MDKKTIQTYNLLAKEYDEETKDFWERFPVGFIEKFASETKVGRVLDIGSGPGRDALLLKNAGLEVTCLDASKSMIERTTKLGFPSVLSDLMKLPFTSEAFSAVWTYTTLLHIPKNKFPKALKEIYRVLNKKGLFALGMIEGVEEDYSLSSGVDKPRYFAFYTKEELEHLLTSTGFTVFHFQEFKPGSKKYLNFLARKI